MVRRSARRAVTGTMVAGCLLLAPAAYAEDFLSALFGGFGGGRPQAPTVPLSYANPFPDEGRQIEAAPPAVPRPRASYGGGRQAFCVRSCDGRYFPVAGSDQASRAASCNDFCPAADTEIAYGSDIDHAVTTSGKPYSKLPNAFRYRNEIVAGCSCNGKDQFGLAPVGIEEDPTLRKGDLVASANGLMAAGRGADRRGASLNFSPVAKSALARDRVPVVASE